MPANLRVLSFSPPAVKAVEGAVADIYAAVAALRPSGAPGTSQFDHSLARAKQAAAVIRIMSPAPRATATVHRLRA